jgi:hypothetical protein
MNDMQTFLRRTALAAALLGSSASLALAQAGPVDSKGQGGAAAHRGVVEPSGSREDAGVTGRATSERSVGATGSVARPGSEAETGATLRGHSDTDGAERR